MIKERNMAPKNALDEVIVAMERLGDVFAQEIEDQRGKGRDEAQLSRLTKGADAMRDAAGLYLTWSHHYISELNHPEEEGTECFDPDGGADSHG
jgi:hypothetical protein